MYAYTYHPVLCELTRCLCPGPVRFAPLGMVRDWTFGLSPFSFSRERDLRTRQARSGLPPNRTTTVSDPELPAAHSARTRYQRDTGACAKIATTRYRLNHSTWFRDHPTQAQKGLHLSQMKYSDLEETLCRLTTVDAVRVIGDNGAISEVHVLASPGKVPKQVVRDVQSLAMASFGISIDRRVVSVVQIENEELLRSDRPAVTEITETPDGSRSKVSVSLTWKNELFVGEAVGPSGPTSRVRLVGEATLAALERSISDDTAFALASLELPRVGSRDVAVAQIVMVSGGEERFLVGCALAGGDPAQAAVRSVLDAVNRVVPQLKR